MSRPVSKSDKIVPVNNIIERFIKRMGFTPDMYAVYEIWERELGTMARHARIAGIQKGRLMVETDSNVYTQELYMMQNSLIRKINEPFGRKVFQKIVTAPVRQP